MKAALLFKEKHNFENGNIAELVLWQLPHATIDRKHSFKYRLYYRNQQGECLVRYDNETGKGDHKHIMGKELSYDFVDVDTLIKNFYHDVA